jgi:ATP-dependent exoDNAse (exonuclease V) beta subunit
MASELVDDPARTQASKNLNHSVFIEAGAGTGKSSTLVSRIINTICRDEPRTTIDQIAAITFTDKAGTELRHRLREGLEKQLAELPDDESLIQALKNLDGATVGTIHSFAQQILREHAISAGIPVGFTLATDSDASAARNIRAREAVGQMYAELDADARAVLRAFGISVHVLRELVQRIDENALRLSDLAFVDDRVGDIEVLRSRIVEQLTDFWLQVQSSCSDPEDKLLVRFTEVLPMIIQELASAGPLRMAELLHEWSNDSGPWLPALGGRGQKANWTVGEPKDWRDAYKEFAAPVAEFLFTAADAQVRRGLKIAWRYITEQRRVRATSGMLEFDDLLIFTRDLLASNRDVRAYVHQQYRVVMVDEFQDTDPLQWHIVRMITADPDDDSHVPLAGHLVVVGDPKQAIYSFRGADVATYIDARTQFLSDPEPLGEVLSLVTNFRSVRPVIDVVNEVFSHAMAPSVSQQVNYAALTAAHDPGDPDAGPAYVVVRDPIADDSNPGKYKSREMEPKQIAYAISRAVREGWKVTEPVEPRSRAYQRRAQFSDITILYPARTGRAALLDALDDAGIPYRSADAGLVYDRPAVLGLRAALTYAAEGLADLNLWLALKSPLFGLTDKDLLDFRLAGGRWRRSAENPSGPVAQAIDVLTRARSTAARCTPLQLMDDLITATRIMEAMPLSHRGNFEADCIRMFRSHAQQWQDEGGVGLYEYLQWIDSVVENAHRTALPEPDDREDNAVRLMTTFQAKGLEFPIVALAGMSHSPGSNDPMLGIASPERFELKLSQRHMSTGYSRWYQDEYRPKQRAEDTRVLYVAFTRARDHLIISLAGERISVRKTDGELIERPPYASLLWPAMPRAESDITEIPEDFEPFSHPTPDAMPGVDASWISAVKDIRETTKAKWVASPSGLGAIALGIDLSAEAIDEHPSGPDESAVDPARQRRDGSAIGQSVHRALDVLVREEQPLPERIEAVCRQMAQEEEATAHLQFVIALTTAALESETIAHARSAQAMWTELYLAAPVEYGGVKVVDGLADLVYRHTSGIHIIDYKTDASIGEHNLPHYREQLTAYAELMRRGTGQSSITASVLHLTESGSNLIRIVTSVGT